MVTRPEISHRYEKYIQQVANFDLISHNDEDVDYPTKRAIQREDFNLDIRNISVDNSHRYLLTNDEGKAGIRYMSPEILAWLSIKLTDILKINICNDHREYWWFTHDFSRAYAEDNGLFPLELVDNLELLIQLVLCTPSMNYYKANSHSESIIWESKTLASYLSYPTLEGFVKNACRDYIKMDGKIKEGRKIRKLTRPGVKEYLHHDDGDGICSNLGMLLWHLESEVVRSQNRTIMRKMRDKVSEIFDLPADKNEG